jgi:hypothetical protein
VTAAAYTPSQKEQMRSNNQETSPPQDARNCDMELFWQMRGLYWELYWELHWLPSIFRLPPTEGRAFSKGQKKKTERPRTSAESIQKAPTHLLFFSSRPVFF